MNHNAMGGRYWGRLYDEFAAFQLALLDGEELVGEVHALPVPRGRLQLPAGWDEAFERGMEQGDGNVALAPRDQRPAGAPWRRARDDL